eukprot:gene11478-15343_t
MNIKTLVAAGLAAILAVTAAAPALAAGDPAKHQKRIHRMIRHADSNRDGRVSLAEMDAALTASFAVLDTNHDGVLSKAEIANRRDTYKAHRQQLKAERKSGQRVAGVVKIPKAVGKHFARIDANGDGVISRSELASVAERVFKRRDHNGDGVISAADFKAGGPGNRAACVSSSGGPASERHVRAVGLVECGDDVAGLDRRLDEAKQFHVLRRDRTEFDQRLEIDHL